MQDAIGAALGAILLLAPVAGAQDVPPTGGRVPTVTRLVKVMTALEGQWADAVAHGDRARLERFLDEDYELRLGAQPGVPIPRAEYLEAAGRSGPQLVMKQMAVRSLGDLAIVSFLGEPGGIGGVEGGLFIVDVWRQKGEEWTVLARYSSESATTAAPKP